MRSLSNSFVKQLQELVEDYLDLSILSSGEIKFSSNGKERMRFTLDYSYLSEEIVLKVASILVGSYEEFHKLARPADQFASVSFLTLNNSSEESARFVATVVDLEGSALHKLLLLTSGYYFGTDNSIEEIIKLALAKTDECATVEKDLDQNSFCGIAENLYLISGISPHTDYRSISELESSLLHTDAFFVSQILAFISNDEPNRTLAEHQSLEVVESVTVTKPLIQSSVFRRLTAVASSKYSDIAKTLTARELRSLIRILDTSTCQMNFPQDFLKRRAIEISKSPLMETKNNILSFLSEDERNSVQESSFDTELTKIMQGLKFRISALSVLYAALAEVFVARGERVTIEVAKELEIVQHIDRRNEGSEIWEAAVMLVLEALEPNAKDCPFAWTAHLSEHAWVLTSHIKDVSNLELKV